MTVDFCDYKKDDIVDVIVNEEFCGLPKGTHRGVVIELANCDELVIVFTDLNLIKRADKNGVWQHLNYGAWDNCEMELVYRMSE